MERKFTKEEKTLLNSAHPITRWLIVHYLKNGKKLTKVFASNIQNMNFIEGNIYKIWHQKCLQEMCKIKLQHVVAEVYERVADPSVSVKQALSLVRRYYNRKDYADKQKQLTKMIIRLKELMDREAKLYKECKSLFEDVLIEEGTYNVDTLIKSMENKAKEQEALGSVDSEDLLFVRQCIKHVNRRREEGREPRISALIEALEPRFVTNPDLYDKQIDLVCATKVVSDEVKTVCYDFIKASVEIAGVFPMKLIEFIFRDNFVSEKSYELLSGMSGLIISQGMHPWVLSEARKLATELGLFDKDVEDLTLSDKHILKLIEVFS